jgi:hypothetical protein
MFRQFIYTSVCISPVEWLVTEGSSGGSGSKASVAEAPPAALPHPQTLAHLDLGSGRILVGWHWSVLSQYGQEWAFKPPRSIPQKQPLIAALDA